MRKTKTLRTNWLIAAAAATLGVAPVIAAPPDANNNTNTGQGVAGNSNLNNGAPNATGNTPTNPGVTDANTNANGNNNTNTGQGVAGNSDPNNAANTPSTPGMANTNVSTNGNTNMDNGIPRSEQSLTFALPAGIRQTDVTSASGIKSGLVKMTDSAVTKGSFNNFLAELSVQDREKAREYKNPDQSRLDSSIQRIQSAWQAKYNRSIDISDKNLVFNDRFTIIQGKVEDPNLALANWPVAACSRAQQSSDISVNSNVSSVNGNTATPYTGSTDQQKEIDDAKLTKGRDVALVRIPAGDGLPEMTVSMIFHYPLFWRVDAPKDRTGEQIYNDLASQLDWIAGHTEQWPSNVDDAYRMVARHAAAALYGVGPTSASADIGH
jgi:hypothetical protein